VIFFARSIRQNYTGVTESNQSKRFAKMTNVCGCNWAFFGYRQTATRNNVANPLDNQLQDPWFNLDIVSDKLAANILNLYKAGKCGTGTTLCIFMPI